ncbi:GNAT family N-acetyltransferase [Seonamhaeicola sp. ML3]|uniref:GNAT family N-acetyltransferase n=1 Tax=Seonamhaeicola sp. ML3 TaxID=2937786 RepID=UPI00200F7FA8|nr:GNAT family N-acetyltransferase [Seonamhaeicola sp. ML3]
MNYHIKFITAKETHTVRHPVLRPGKPISSCIFYGDELDNNFHLGLYKNTKLVGVASFFNNKHPSLKFNRQYQLRGMAILEPYQGKGLGNRLINHAEDILKAKHIEAIWCNARKIAVNFYSRNNFQIKGDPFEIEDIGTHYVMFKKI